jgi:hypothetical protein
MLAELIKEARITRVELDTLARNMAHGLGVPAFRHPGGRLAAAQSFHPHYAGWTLQKATADGPKSGRHVQIASWKVPVIMPLTFSSEELFLQVTGFVAKNARTGQTLRDIYNGLRTQGQRDAIRRLISHQNQLLQRDSPQLEWKLAGLRYRARQATVFNKETVLLLVILKTQLKVDHPKIRPHPLLVSDPSRARPRRATSRRNSSPQAGPSSAYPPVPNQWPFSAS